MGNSCGAEYKEVTNCQMDEIGVATRTLRRTFVFAKHVGDNDEGQNQRTCGNGKIDSRGPLNKAHKEAELGYAEHRLADEVFERDRVAVCILVGIAFCSEIPFLIILFDDTMSGDLSASTQIERNGITNVNAIGAAFLDPNDRPGLIRRLH